MYPLSRKITTIMFGCILVIILLGVSFFAVDINNYFENEKSTNSASKYKFLALGDSYTIGKNVEINETWPEQLILRLNSMNIFMDNVTIVAHSGWSTSELLKRLDFNWDNNFNPINPPYDLVTLMIGVNNQFRDKNITEFKSELIELMNRAIRFANNNASKVIVLSIPDWGATPFADGRDKDKIASEIDIFNLVILEQSKLLGIIYVDVTTISRTASNDATLLSEDNLHPSGKMYNLWVELLVPYVKNILR
jgi:lysophospholipase L1-like esterase